MDMDKIDQLVKQHSDELLAAGWDLSKWEPFLVSSRRMAEAAMQAGREEAFHNQSVLAFTHHLPSDAFDFSPDSPRPEILDKPTQGKEHW